MFVDSVGKGTIGFRNTSRTQVLGFLEEPRKGDSKSQTGPRSQAVLCGVLPGYTA